MNAWCHGAAGVALSRLGILEALGPDEALGAELSVALETVAGEGLLPLDHLCCGNAGRIEALVCAAERLSEPRFRERARALSSELLARAEREGKFRFRRDGSGADQPGFFRGLAGLGYTLLRVAAPGVLPAVALLEASPRAAASPEPVSAERIVPLDRDEAFAFGEMTFPAYRHLLSLEPAPRHRDMAATTRVTPVAVGVYRDGAPAGLALAELPDGTNEAEVLSLFVAPEHRGEGLGPRLLLALETELRSRGIARVHGVFMTEQPGTPALERVLAKAAWDAPVPRMLTARFSLDAARRTDWYGRYPLTEGFEVFPWGELPPQERRALRASQEERKWIKPDLVPWNHDAYGFEPVSSLGVRHRGELVGWVINHALSPALVRFTCSFIRRDLGRRGKLVPVFSESIRRLSERTTYEECTLTVPLIHAGMAGFLRRWCAPRCSFVAETRGVGKQLN
jgi:ribosomal protein S18 acetylase RimI-like enzyme